MKHLLAIAIIFILIISACKSKGGATADNPCNLCENAIIQYYGDPALDGCGWVVNVSSTIYMPENLLPEFSVDSLEVSIKYKVLDRVNCGLIKDKYSAIFIEEMYKKK